MLSTNGAQEVNNLQINVDKKAELFYHDYTCYYLKNLNSVKLLS